MAKKFLRLPNGNKLRIKLKLQRDRIEVVGYEEDGTVWGLLALKADGTFSRATFIDEIGLKLDDEGRIIESPE